jgi:hypothetical protein
MSTSIYDSLIAILDYIQPDEERHFHENGEPTQSSVGVTSG